MCKLFKLAFNLNWPVLGILIFMPTFYVDSMKKIEPEVKSANTDTAYLPHGGL